MNDDKIILRVDEMEGNGYSHKLQVGHVNEFTLSVQTFGKMNQKS